MESLEIRGQLGPFFKGTLPLATHIDHVLGKFACIDTSPNTLSFQRVAAGDIWVGHYSKLNLTIVCAERKFEDLLPWRYEGQAGSKSQYQNLLQLNFQRKLLY